MIAQHFLPQENSQPLHGLKLLLLFIVFPFSTFCQFKFKCPVCSSSSHGSAYHRDRGPVGQGKVNESSDASFQTTSGQYNQKYNTSVYYNNRGIVFFNKGKYEKALEYFKLALEMYPPESNQFQPSREQRIFRDTLVRNINLTEEQVSKRKKAYPNVIRDKNGALSPAPGYEWVNPENETDFQVIPIQSKKSEMAWVRFECSGEFQIINRNGKEIHPSDTKIPFDGSILVVTGNDGKVRLNLADSTTFTVAQNSELVLDEFVYDPDKDLRKIILRLTKGIFRWSTGKVSKTDPANLKIRLPNFAIGVRGTEFEVYVANDHSGYIKVFSGILSIQTKHGDLLSLEGETHIAFDSEGYFSK